MRELGADLAAGEETDITVTIGGRVMLKRDSGKLVFLTVADRGTDLQLFVSKSVIGDERLRRSRPSIGATGSALRER